MEKPNLPFHIDDKAAPVKPEGFEYDKKSIDRALEIIKESKRLLDEITEKDGTSGK